MPRKKPPAPKPSPSPPSISSQLLGKLDPIKGFLTFVMLLLAFLGAAWAGLVKIGWDPVGSGALNSLEERIKRDLTVQLTKLEKLFVRAQIENHETSLGRMKWGERNERLTSLDNIERQIKEHEGRGEQERESYKILVLRRIELKTQIQNIEARIKDTEDRIKKLNEQL